MWVAEADDGSDPRFLETVVTRQSSENASFAFSDSVPIDEDGATLASDYKAYYGESVGNLMDSSFVMDGKSFLERCLAERNLVLNVSAVVWERDALVDALVSSHDALQEYRLAGDWHLYATAALSSRCIAYLASPLNVHRRHLGERHGDLERARARRRGRARAKLRCRGARRQRASPPPHARVRGPPSRSVGGRGRPRAPRLGGARA